MQNKCQFLSSMTTFVVFFVLFSHFSTVCLHLNTYFQPTMLELADNGHLNIQGVSLYNISQELVKLHLCHWTQRSLYWPLSTSDSGRLCHNLRLPVPRLTCDCPNTGSNHLDKSGRSNTAISEIKQTIKLA